MCSHHIRLDKIGELLWERGLQQEKEGRWKHYFDRSHGAGFGIWPEWFGKMNLGRNDMGIEIRLGFLLELWIRLDRVSKVTGLNTLLAFEVVKEKYSPVGGTKWHPTTKERGDTQMWVLRTTFWCFFMEYCWVICQIYHRGVWTDCLLLPLLFLMGSSQQAAIEPFVFHQSIPSHSWSIPQSPHPHFPPELVNSI